MLFHITTILINHSAFTKRRQIKLSLGRFRLVPLRRAGQDRSDLVLRVNSNQLQHVLANEWVARGEDRRIDRRVHDRDPLAERTGVEAESNRRKLCF